MNQSELKANTYRPCQAQENAISKSRLIWFYFWLVEKVAQDFLANHKA